MINSLITRGSRRQYLVISLLLMMACVQTFSMHFHFPDDSAGHHIHAHAHAPGGMEADHLNSGHDDGSISDLPGVIAKQTLSIDIFLFVLLTLIAVTQARLRIPQGARRQRPRYYRLFYRPPLRAPPL